MIEKSHYHSGYGRRGVTLEHNTHGTLVLTARHFGPKRAFFSCKYKTKLFSLYLQLMKAILSLTCSLVLNKLHFKAFLLPFILFLIGTLEFMSKL